MKTMPVAALLAAVLPSIAAAQPKDCGPVPAAFEGLAFADDGDTISAIGFEPRIRLWGIQAPELRDKLTGQESLAGMRSRTALEELLALADWKVSCTPRKWDRYCRVVADCTAGGADISLAMIKQGQAYGFWLHDARASEAQRSVTYARAEYEARRAGRGLWPAWTLRVEEPARRP